MAFIEMKRSSTILDGQTLINVVLPDELQAGERLKTIWLLHGLGDNGTAWQRKTNVEQLAIDHHVAMIMPDMGRSFYMNMPFGSRYWDYLVQECLPQMRTLLPLSTAPADNYLIGNSMGGYGALKLAFAHPDWFRAVVALSAVADLNDVLPMMPDHQAVFGVDDQFLAQNQPTTLIQQVPAKALRQLAWYQAVGRDDPFKAANDRLHQYLTTKYDLKVEYHVAAGAHDWPFWREQLEQVVPWLLTLKK